MAEISIGSVLGGYRIEGVAGEGGMGRVYRSTQIALNRQVALKVIMPELAHEADFRARFTREAELAASIDHPNVIPVYEAGEAEGRLFIAMRWVDGTDLRSVIVRDGPLGAGRVVAIVEQVAAALDGAHRGGLVHRDVKPANVMLTSVHGQEHVYLTDFGLTKRAESAPALTRTGAFVGTPDYMPPEQIQGQRPDARTDVYALGCLLFQALTGRPPYDRDTEIAKMYAHLHDPPPSVVAAAPAAPAGLDGVVSRALAKQPDDRYPSAGDLARAARAALTGALPSQPERSLATGLAAPAALGPTAPGIDETALAGGPGPTAAPTPPSATPPPATPPPATPPPATPPPATPPPATPPPATPAPATPPPATPPPEPGPTAMPGAPAPGPTAATPPPPPTAPPPERRPRRALPFALAGLVALGAVVAALAAAGVFSGGDEEPPADDAADGTEQTPPPRTPPKVAATIRAGNGPDGIAVDGNTVWVSNSRGGTLTRLDTQLNSAVGNRIPVGANPDEVEAADGVVWVSNTDDGTVTRVDAGSGETTDVAVGLGPEGLSLGEQLLWVANGDSDSVSRVDRAAATLLDPPIAVQNKPIGIFVGENTVWVTNSFSGTVTRIDSSTAEIIGTTDFIARNIRSVIEAFGFVWVTSAIDGGTVTRLDPETGEIVGRPIRLGDRPKEMAVAAGFLWVVNERSNNVMRINPKTFKVVGRPIRVGNTPVGIAAGAGSLWVTNNRSNNVTRIDPGSRRGR
jgi:serine/threonine protein kinase/DNA-binding beta-propeller fold protein YncE